MQPGRMYRLEVTRMSPHGAYLTDGQGEVLLPTRYMGDAQVGQSIQVFVHLDSDDRLVAARKRPTAIAGEFAALPVTQVNEIGAFVDFGLDKELLIPFREQGRPLRVGENPVVRVVFDEVSGRLFGSTRLRRYLRPAEGLKPNEPVEFLPYTRLDNGLRVVVDDQYDGAIFNAPREVRIGERAKGYVFNVDEDGRVTVGMAPAGLEGISAGVDQLLAAFQRNENFLPVHDGSPPEEIRRRLNMSKATFKRAVGMLMREGRIEMTKFGTRLTG